MGNSCCNHGEGLEEASPRGRPPASQPPVTGVTPPVAQADTPASSQSVASAENPPVRTLKQEDPALAARHAAYQQRKEARRQIKMKQAASLADPGSKPALENGVFLSGLPEVEADIRYRFNFVVVGTKAKQVIEAVVNSKAANDLPGSVALASSNPKPEDETLRPMGSADSLDGSPRDSPRITSPRKRMLRQRLKNQTYRCLCKVVDPLRGEIAAKDDKEKPLLAKMVLRPLPLIEDVPLCSTHLEALSTVIVFLLQLDNKKNTIDEQLAMIHQAIQRMRSRTRSKLRPVRAIMITQGEQGSAGSTEPEESWGPKLSEFEESYGKTWQFGPLNEVDGDALQATFGEMASVRIKQNEANEGTQMFNEEEEDVLLLESELELQDPEYAEKAAEERLVRVLSGRSRPSETSSTTSEGAHRPPMFEAEFEGSQCSESAMELHARIFGLEDIPSQEAS